jgi:hypothetical protein
MIFYTPLGSKKLQGGFAGSIALPTTAPKQDLPSKSMKFYTVGVLRLFYDF